MVTQRRLGGLVVAVFVLAAGCGDTVDSSEVARCAEVKQAEAEFRSAVEAKGQQLEELKSRRAQLSPLDRSNRGSGEVVRAEAEVREAFKPLLVLIEQNPDCYTPRERAEAEALLRNLDQGE